MNEGLNDWSYALGIIQENIPTSKPVAFEPHSDLIIFIPGQ